MNEQIGSMQALRSQADQHLWLRWTVATALGELVGFSVPTLIGIAAVWALAPLGHLLADILQVGIMVLAGAAEGAILGWAQWLVLRHAFPPMRRRAWVLATTGGAVVAWFIGGTLGTFANISGFAPAALVAGAVVLVLVLGTVIGAAQWFVLRRYVARAAWWIPANTLAWSLGLVTGLGGPALIQETTPVVVAVLIGVASGVAMGVLSGAVTGIALVWLLRNGRGHGDTVTR